MLKRIDLTRDYENHKEEYMEAIEMVCKETAFSGGKYADKFDEEFAKYCQVPYAAGVNNGTSALHCAMVALGIGAGDEVIVPANTYIATAWGVTYSGATPVFVDCTSDTWEIDPDKIEEKITDKTKAIMGVHLYGQPFEFNKVKAIADKYNLYIVEDCAQAHGALYEGKIVGSLADLGCFSFYPGKNLYAFGEGGSVTCYKKEYFDGRVLMQISCNLFPFIFQFCQQDFFKNLFRTSKIQIQSPSADFTGFHDIFHGNLPKPFFRKNLFCLLQNVFTLLF